MGVKRGFPAKQKEFLGKYLSDLKGLSGDDKAVAVDGSIILYRGCLDEESARQFHHLPKVLLGGIKRSIQDFDDFMKYHKITYVVVLDGLPNECKLASKERRENADKALIELTSLLQMEDDSPTVHSRILTLMRQSLVLSRLDIDADAISVLKALNIPHIRAPFEADPMLVELVNCGICTHIWSTDSDIWVLGGDSICEAKSFNEETHVHIISDSDEGLTNFSRYFLPHSSDEFTMMRDLDWRRVIAILLGCDFFPEIKGMSEKNLMKLLEDEFGLIDEDSGEVVELDFWKIIDFLSKVDAGQLGLKWNKSYGYSAGGPCSEVNSSHGGSFTNLFWRAYACFAYPPVWKIISVNGGLPATRADFFRGEYKVKLRSLYDIPDWFFSNLPDPIDGRNNDDCWRGTSMFGYDPWLTMSQLAQQSSTDIRKLGVYFAKGKLSKDGTRPIEEVRLIPPTTISGMIALFESIKDFDNVKLVHYSARSLRIFITSRGINLNANTTKEEMRSIIREKVFSVWTANKDSQDEPRILPAREVKLFHRNIDELFVSNQVQVDVNELPLVVYTIRDDFISRIRDPTYLLPITDDLLCNLFREFKMGVAFFERIKRLFNGGHVDLSSMKSREAFIRKDPNDPTELIPVFVVTCSVVASMKSKTHTCCLIFDRSAIVPHSISDTHHFITHRVSRCTCEAGRWLCSHMLATLLLLRLIQQGASLLSFNELFTVLPDPIKLINAILLPCSTVYGGAKKRKRNN